MTDQATVMTSEHSQRLQDLTPSAKLVAKTLEYEGNLTQRELVQETLLPARTVRYGLAQLRENDLVTAKTNFVDARQQIYSLARFPDSNSD